MIVRTLTSLLIAICVLVAAHLARPIGFADFALTSNGTIAEVTSSSEHSAFAPGDRLIAVNDRPYVGHENLAKRVSPWDSEADVRTVSLKNLKTQTLQANQLHQELPEILRPTYYLLQIDQDAAYGETASKVAQVLRERDRVQVQAVPTIDVDDRTVKVSRGVPPLLSFIAIGVALLAVFILWAGAPLLGATLGLFAAGAALWLDVAYPSAQLLGLALLALGVITGVWLFVGDRARHSDESGQRALRAEGEDADSNLLNALERAEQRIGSRLYIVVGAGAQAIEISRDYERILVERADSVLTSTLSMLAIEGGAFPRIDTGENVRDPWGDPLQDLDNTVQIAAAVPLSGYGHGQDRWAFVIARTWDVTASPQLVEQIAREIDTWEHRGVREAISMQATHGLLHIMRQDTSMSASPTMRSDGEAWRDTPMHSHLDNLSEGVGIPRVISRAELEKSPRVAKPPSLPAVPDDGQTRPTPPRKTDLSLAHVSEGVGVPRTVRREDLQRMRAHVAIQDTPLNADSSAKPAAIHSPERSADTRLKAWTGHLDRRLKAAYPVDDPQCYRASDWRRLEPVLRTVEPALLYGEAGAGKEFAVRAVHERSARADRPIAVIDCDDLSESSVELEVFGLKDDPGVLSGIMGGAVVFISPLKLSVSTLDAIAQETRALDIRLFFLIRHQAESLPLSKTAAGEWLADQIAERVVRIPPLRERPEDILPAARWMLAHYSVLYAGGQPRTLSSSAARWLKSQQWTANYWDLASSIRAAVLRTDEDVIGVASFWAEGAELMGRAGASEDTRTRLVQVLHRTDGNKDEAARILGISAEELVRQLRRNGLM